MKPTDTQLVLLSAASRREDGGIELAPNLKCGAAHKVVGKLLSTGIRCAARRASRISRLSGCRRLKRPRSGERGQQPAGQGEHSRMLETEVNH